MPTILIPDAYTPSLPPLPFNVVRFPAIGPAPVEAKDAEAFVFWRGMGRKITTQLLETMPKLRWVQALTAGVDPIILSPAWRDGIVLTNGRGLHDAPTAELALALILSGVRNMHRWRDEQHKKVWDSDAYIRQLEGIGPPSTLEGARVLILGMGSIGLDIAHKLKPFGAHIEGVAQHEGIREGFVVHGLANMRDEAAKADVVVAVLPDTKETQNVINGEFLARLRKTAWLINVGRGSAVDEAALYAALSEGRIAGFAGDVFAKEPLPTESPLWGLQNAIITPHIAGGGPRFYEKAAALLQRNAEAFVKGAPLENIIDVKKGY